MKYLSNLLGKKDGSAKKVSAILLAMAGGLIIFAAFRPIHEPHKPKVDKCKNGIIPILEELTGPVDSTDTELAIAKFQSDYKTDVGLTYDPVKMKMTADLEKVFTLLKTKTDSGMTFHYALTDNKKDVCYIAALGARDGNGDLLYRKFPASVHGLPISYYILLENNAGDTLKFIDQNTFCRLTKNYRDNMKRLDGGNHKPISGDPSHPYYVYHEGTELNAFYEEYENTPSPYLYIEHGANKPTVTSPDYHAAHFLFGDGNGSYELDDAINTGEPYRKKAMDIGQLCPPGCTSEMASSCD